MKKESHLCCWQSLLYQLRQQHQMIVVHPDDVAVLVLLHNSVSESDVCCSVRSKLLVNVVNGVDGEWDVVEQRPQDAVAVACRKEKYQQQQQQS